MLVTVQYWPASDQTKKVTRWPPLYVTNSSDWINAELMKGWLKALRPHTPWTLTPRLFFFLPLPSIFFLNYQWLRWMKKKRERERKLLLLSGAVDEIVECLFKETRQRLKRINNFGRAKCATIKPVKRGANASRTGALEHFNTSMSSLPPYKFPQSKCLLSWFWIRSL